MMNERLLQYIWQMQYFNDGELSTVDGRALRVLHPGLHNRDQGPDFLHARILLDGVTWTGHIELHMRPEDWDRHGHTRDRRYDNVILHVVWTEGDWTGKAPLLVLGMRVPKLLLERYGRLIGSAHFVPCDRMIGRVGAMTWMHWLERLLMERLIRRRRMLLEDWERLGRHWEELCWRRLAYNFGYRVNAAAFYSIADSIPVTLLAKLRDRPDQVEALLLGQAGLLDGLPKSRVDDHAWMLRREYEFLAWKHDLARPGVQLHFLRMRPRNFPEIRMAQLGAVMTREGMLFDRWVQALDVRDVLSTIDAEASEYWQYHYRLGERGKPGRKRIGRQMQENVIINTVVPLLFAYGEVRRDEQVQNKALSWLISLRPEQNHLIGKWKNIGIVAGSALEAQALLELYHQYCTVRRCLDCAVGHWLLRERDLPMRQSQAS